MQPLTSNTWRLSASVGANAYLVRIAGRLLLVDPGLELGLHRVARDVRAAGFAPRSVTDILLTHYDPDHAGAAYEWQRRTDATVWLGGDDVDILQGRTKPPTALRRAMALPGLPKLPHNLRRLEEGTEIAPGLTAVPTPGHTPGHFAFVTDEIAFIGDAANTDSTGWLAPFPVALMSDLSAGLRSRDRLAGLDVAWFAPGHTPPRLRAA